MGSLQSLSGLDEGYVLASVRYQGDMGRELICSWETANVEFINGEFVVWVQLIE